MCQPRSRWRVEIGMRSQASSEEIPQYPKTLIASVQSIHFMGTSEMPRAVWALGLQQLTNQSPCHSGFIFRPAGKSGSKQKETTNKDHNIRECSGL